MPSSASAAPLVALAMLAARADGQTVPAEEAAIADLVTRLGSPDISRLADQVASRHLRVADLAERITEPEDRRLAYEAALAVCHADGAANPAEQQFLEELRQALGLSSEEVAEMGRTADTLSGARVEVHEAGSGPAAQGEAALDEMILQQAILTGAVEILPDRLANIAVLPLQLRLVYRIGQHYGQQLDGNQVKDLAVTLGLGTAAQAMEGVVLKLVGGLAGGLLGGLVGGASRIAAGAAVTFATTYALGHVAKQYYAQGRHLSAGDLRGLFQRFKEEANTIYPRVEQQIRSKASTLDLGSLASHLKA